MVDTPSSLVDSLAPDAAHYVKSWAREMGVSEGEIVTRLVRQTALAILTRRSGTTLGHVREALAVKVPYGRASEFVLAAINSRPGPWRIPEILQHLLDVHHYRIDRKSLAHLLTGFRRSGQVVSGGIGIVRRVEPQP